MVLEHFCFIRCEAAEFEPLNVSCTGLGQIEMSYLSVFKYANITVYLKTVLVLTTN